MSKHTPGPWRVDSHFNIFYKDAMVAFPCISGGLDQKANARLIAAAPELLEALQEMFAAERANSFEIVGRDTDGHPLNAMGVARKNARAAITKATGEQS